MTEHYDVLLVGAGHNGLTNAAYLAGRHGVFALSVIAMGIGVAFLYWILNSFCLSLGYGGVLPPIVAAWVANCVFACASVAALSNPE